MAKMKETRALQLLSFLCMSITSMMSNDVCRPYDVFMQSECTSGFASKFHIEVVEDQTGLRVHDSRQVLIPAMTFKCSGTLTKWIFPAIWRGNSQAFTELQIWRRTNSSGNVYFKAGATTIHADGERGDRIYEIPVNTPLQFQTGDIIGYFQPHRELSQLSIYLEDSVRIDTFRDNVANNLTLPPEGIFDFGIPHIKGEDYPLIGADTDPPNCGCGLVTMQRMEALLAHDRNDFGTKNIFPQELMIFPRSQFTCSGKIVKWTVGGTFMVTGSIYPELQIWRPTSNTAFEKLSGVTIITLTEASSGIYEFVVNPPIPVEPGDILGVFQPSLLVSRFLVDFDSSDNANNFYIFLDTAEVIPTRTFIDVERGEWQRGTILPLVTADISTPNLVITTTNTQPTPTQTTTATPTPVITQTVTSPTTQLLTTFQPTPSTPTVLVSSMSSFTGSAPIQTNTVTQDEMTSQQKTSISIQQTVDSVSTDTEGNLTFYVGLGVVVMLLALIGILVVILLLVLLYPKKGSMKQKPVHPPPDGSNGPEYVVYTDTTDAPASLGSLSPNNTEQVFDDPIYNAPTQQNSNGNVLDTRDLQPIQLNDLSSNPITAYAISNVHCTTNKASVDSSAPNNDYDYAEP